MIHTNETATVRADGGGLVNIALGTHGEDITRCNRILRARDLGGCGRSVGCLEQGRTR